MAKSRYTTERIIKRYRDKLEEMGIEVEKLILFGSFAKKLAKEGSDIDLIVISKSFKGMNLRERLELLGIASAHIFEPIQALGYTPEELKAGTESFLKEAISSGVEL